MSSKITSLLQLKDSGGGNDLLSARQREQDNVNIQGKIYCYAAATGAATVLRNT